MKNKLQKFKNEPVTFVEALNVKEGVVCDVYTYSETNEKDLGVISVAPNTCTPLQKVLKGEKTIEGFVSGDGVLKIVDAAGKTNKHTPRDEGEEVIVRIGEMMQWCAGDSELLFYEICHPPYVDGRYENLTD